MNRNTLCKGLLALSLALNLGTIAAVLIGQVRAPQTAPAAHSAVELPGYLGLSAEQRQRWQQLEPAFLQELAANWAEIRRHREALVRHIFAEAPQRAAIDAEQATIAALQAAQQQRVIAQLLAERELLDAGQRAKLMDLLLGRYAQESTEEELLHRP